ncbi:MAG: hypothetical protein GQ557_00090 [Mycoplasmataceae bacterium]|nr:hypothetical protein [Mycoplasmataceae bacterium]
MGAIIFLVIFFIIVGTLLLVAFYGARKDKRDKTIKLTKENRIENKAVISHAKLYLKLNSLVNFIEEQTKDFDASTAPLSIGKLNALAQDELRSIQKSQELKDIFASEVRKQEFKPVIDNLIKNKPTNWSKDAFFAVSVIKNKAKFIKEEEEFSDVRNEVGEIQWS